jgi:lipopolysaccharide export LptBFGC system permease protein LptF
VAAPHDAFATDTARCVAGSAAAATAVVTIAIWTMPLIALATGAYPSMPVTALNVALLFGYLSPTALVVAIPMGLSTGVLAACGRPSDARRIRVAVVLMVIVATVVACMLFLWLAPITSRAYRELAAPAGGELRVNRPGTIGYRVSQHERWALLCANAVLATFALSAAAAASPRRRWVRLGAGIASVGYPFLYVPVAVLAFSGVVPAALAAWLPNILFATATLLLVGWNRIG